MQTNNLNKKDILIVITNLETGGGEYALTHFLKNMDYNRYNVDLLILKEPETLLYLVPSEVNVIFAYKNNPYFSVRFFEGLNRCIRDKKIKYLMPLLLLYIIKNLKAKNFKKLKFSLCKFFIPINEYYDVSMAFEGQCYKYAAKNVNSRIKIIRWIHGKVGIPNQKKINIYRNFDYIVTLNNTLKEYISERYKFNKDKIRVIPNIFKKDEIIKKADEYIINKKKKYLFCTIGRIVPLKRIDIAVLVAEQLVVSGIKDFEWYIIGYALKNSYIKPIKKMIKDKKLENYIKFTGDLRNPFPYIKVSDIYLHTSETESWCRVITEALILGKPVLATKTIGACNQIKPGINGELANIDDPNDFAEKLIKMLDSLDNYKDITFDIDNQDIMNEYYKLFNGEV